MPVMGIRKVRMPVEHGLMAVPMDMGGYGLVGAMVMVVLVMLMGMLMLHGLVAVVVWLRASRNGRPSPDCLRTGRFPAHQRWRPESIASRLARLARVVEAHDCVAAFMPGSSTSRSTCWFSVTPSSTLPR